VSQLNVKAASEAVRTFRRRAASGQIGFPKLPNDSSTVQNVLEFAEQTRPTLDVVVLLGIGGSALGAQALDGALRGPHPFQGIRGKKGGRQPRLVVLDNVDPGIVTAAIAQLNPKRTAVCVVTKSGSTAETMATFLVVHGWMRAALGNRVRERVIAITDPQKGDLLAIARQEGYPLFLIPPNVAGRFSVFSCAGLVPAALVGIDIRKLLHGAADASELCWQDSIETNPALASALLHHALVTQKGKTIEAVFAYSSYLWGTARWYRQLWAESLGKEIDRKGRRVEAGQTPIASLGPNDQHSQLQLYLEGPRDKMITFWAVGRPRAEVIVPRAFSRYGSCSYLGGKRLSELLNAERVATEAALTQAGRPNCRWSLPRIDEYHLGAFLQILHFQTAFAGELFNVDAFDQPAVELGRKIGYSLMGRRGHEHYARELRASGQKN
jgi:glucose-6-phosphate isomerase